MCPPYTALGAIVDSSRGSRVQVFAQNMHQAAEGPFTGEISPPMLSELDVDGVILATPSAASSSPRATAALQLKVSAALVAGLVPLLCVGESEEERERGDTERRLRHQVQEGLREVSDEFLAEVVIAYEPIWAIGTGQVATADQAQEAVAFIRALVGDRHPPAAEQVRVLYGGSVTPDNANELLGLPDVDGALVGGASLDPEAFARDRGRRTAMSVPPGPAHVPVPAVCLVVLDGWGLAAARPGECGGLAHTPVFDELWATYPRPGSRPAAQRRPARGPDGQLRGRPPQPRRRLVVHQDLTRIDDAVADGSLRSNEALRAAFTAGERVHLLGLASDGGVHAGFGHLEALIAMGAELGAGDLVVHAFTDGRDTFPTAGAATWRPSRAGAGHQVSRGWAASWAATSRWTAIGAGTGCRPPTTCWSPATLRPRGDRRAGGPRCLRARRDRRVRRAHAGRRGGGDPSGERQRASASTSAPTACARSFARWPSRFTEVDRRGREPVAR